MRRLALAASLLALSCTTTPEERWVAQCMDDLGMMDIECRVALDWRLPDALPPSRGNAHADDPAAAALGHRLFFDTSLSTTGVSCASCHAPEHAFAQDTAVSEVIVGMPGTRNSPSLMVAARNEGFWLWDGAADSLWSQPLFAIENPIEMASSRLALAHHVAEDPALRAGYESVFGALPLLSDGARFPPAGRPGDPAWSAMTEADRFAIDEVAANVGKALEAYLRRIASGPSRLDRYLDGDRSALDHVEKRGLVRFVRGGCILCHDGPMLTDDAFHVAAMEDDDRGRAAGIETLLASPFNGAGLHTDPGTRAPLALPLGPVEGDERAFRTPSLRNVALTAPYTHDGGRSMNDILTTPSFFYEPGDELVIEAFLGALTGAPPPAEWTAPP